MTTRETDVRADIAQLEGQILRLTAQLRRERDGTERRWLIHELDAKHDAKRNLQKELAEITLSTPQVPV